MQKRWNLVKHDYDTVRVLADELEVAPLIAALLITRGYSDAVSARQFLSPTLDDLNDPFLLKGMDAAVARIHQAIDRGETILVWGDYDVDGTTGTVLLRKALTRLGAATEFHVPNRFTEGYGLNIDALRAAKDRGVGLVITVDCGVRSFEPIAWAADNGLDVIVTDHHLSDPEHGLPRAVAVVNPNQAGCTYPDKALAGVGVALKLSLALLGDKADAKLVNEFLEVAAIGTVADVMDLNGENRSIVTLGLRQLSRTRNHGLRALMEVADCTSEMRSVDIGFRIGPRINAAGRMDVATHVVELLESEDVDQAWKLAKVLDSRNSERQRIQREVTESAIMEAANTPDGSFIVVAGDRWHRGVVGLAASRIADRFNRPVVVLSIEDGFGHGSARSIANFHVLDALERCSDIFESFGGHAAAAGMKIKPELIGELRDRLNSYAADVLTDDLLVPEIRIDALVTADTMGLDIVSKIKSLEPFGMGNPRPVFLTRGLTLRNEPRILKEKHLKFDLIGGSGKRFDAVWWDGLNKLGQRTAAAGSRIELVYTADENVWQGTRRLQLTVLDLKIDEQ